MVVRQRGQRVTHSAEKVIGCNLPSLQDLDASGTLKRAGKTAADPFQPGHNLFQTLPSGRRLDGRPGPKQSSHKNGFFSLCSGLRTPTDTVSPVPVLYVFCTFLTFHLLFRYFFYFYVILFNTMHLTFRRFFFFIILLCLLLLLCSVIADAPNTEAKFLTHAGALGNKGASDSYFNEAAQKTVNKSLANTHPNVTGRGGVGGWGDFLSIIQDL